VKDICSIYVPQSSFDAWPLVSTASGTLGIRDDRAFCCPVGASCLAIGNADAQYRKLLQYGVAGLILADAHDLLPFLFPFLAPLFLQLFDAVGHAARGLAAADIQAAAILFGEALLDDPHHRARVELAAFEDDLPVLHQRFGRAVDGVAHHRVEHDARAHVDCDFPRGGKAFGAFGPAQRVEGGVACADRRCRHLDAAAAGKIGDEAALLKLGQAIPALCLARDGDEGEGRGKPGVVVALLNRAAGLALGVRDRGDGGSGWRAVGGGVRGLNRFFHGLVNNPYGFL
jgi:hypothetical protein